jgi:uncharacterized protein (TIRG00374 family)
MDAGDPPEEPVVDLNDRGGGEPVVDLNERGGGRQTLRRRITTRMLVLAVTGISLYVVWPELLRTFTALPDLRRLSPLWIVLMLVLEAVSFGCIWVLQAVLLRTRRIFLIATAQLSGNAFGRIVPAGAAAGGALQYRLLTARGLDSATVGSGLTAASLISTATLTALPLVSIPTVIGGAAVDHGLVRAAMLGAIVFVLFVAAGTVLLTNDAVLRLIGRAIEWCGGRFPALRKRAGEQSGLADRLVETRNRIRATLGRQWWIALLAAAGNWVFDYFALLAALTAVHSNPRPAVVILAYVAAAVLGMIPLTPGGLGFVEAGLTATLVAAGIPAGKAIVATLVYRLVSYWLPLLAGPVAWGLYKFRYARRDRREARADLVRHMVK